MAHPELKALADVLGDLEPTAPTACADWTVHDLVAHLAAGAKEVAELIEEYLAGQPARPTRGFDERERPFRAFTHPGLLAALTEQSRRKIAALEVLAGRGDRAAVAFTGTTMTATQFQTHARSEAALHRWDLVGDDSVCDQLLSQPDLTRHAVNVLNAMPVLDESARIRQSPAPRRIVLTSSGQPDVVIETGHGRRPVRARRGRGPGRTGEWRYPPGDRRRQPAAGALGPPVITATALDRDRRHRLRGHRAGPLARRHHLASPRFTGHGLDSVTHPLRTDRTHHPDLGTAGTELSGPTTWKNPSGTT